MKIGILSDTHARVDLTKHVTQHLKNEGAEFLIHGGDIVKKENLEALEKTDIPYIAVLGNNDNNLRKQMTKYNLVEEPHYFMLKDLKIKIMHHPYYIKADSDLIVYGHTHFFDAKVNKNSFFINPGEVCAKKKDLCECALVEYKRPTWQLKRFTCKPTNIEWKTQTKVYKI